MFMNTIAVGPLEPAELWETGGATVAIERWSNRHVEEAMVRGKATEGFRASLAGIREAIVGVCSEAKIILAQDDGGIELSSARLTNQS